MSLIFTEELLMEVRRLARRGFELQEMGWADYPFSYNRVMRLHLNEMIANKLRYEEMLSLTDDQNEKAVVLKGCIDLERIISDGLSPEYESYCKQGLHYAPNDPVILYSYGTHLQRKQKFKHPNRTDYGCIEYFRRSYENETDPSKATETLHHLRTSEASRDFFNGNLKQIQNMLQINVQPNYNLKEAQWELYKISISQHHTTSLEELIAMKGSDHRVLFQNASGDITTGVYFNDPDIEFEEIYWYNILAWQMANSFLKGEGLITRDDELDCYSCYVELHSHPVGRNQQNHITVQTPLQFLPVTEFEKRQKSIDPSRVPAILSPGKISSSLANKKHANDLKEQGNVAFRNQKYEEAERLYSQKIELFPGLKKLLTNRAMSRNKMKKYEEAISDCDSALEIDSKFAKPIVHKGNALLSLGRFDEARKCFNSLRSLGERNLADISIKKVDATESKKVAGSISKQVGESGLSLMAPKLD